MSGTDGWRVEVFCDGDCPLCMREIAMLMRKDRAGRIRFTNIAAADFDPTLVGLPFASLMASIHGRLPDGTIIQGVEVFRHLYDAVGFRRLVALSRLPGISRALDWAYLAFAKNRLRLTGRCAADGCQLAGRDATA